MTTTAPRPVPPPWSPEMDAELTRLRVAGFSSREIGAALGKSRNACIGRWLRIQQKRRLQGLSFVPPQPKYRNHRPAMPASRPKASKVAHARTPAEIRFARMRALMRLAGDYARNANELRPVWNPARDPKPPWLQEYYGSRGR